MEQVFKCGCPEHLIAEAGAQPQIPRSCSKITFGAVFDGLRGLDGEEFSAITNQSLQKVSAVSGLDISVAPFAQAIIQCRPEPMDLGTLAYAFFPQNVCGQQIQMRLNANIDWTAPVALDTLTHELGHAFGLPHTPDRRDIMAAIIDTSRHLDGEFGPHYSIPEMVERYGAEDDPTKPPGVDLPTLPPIGQVPWDAILEALFSFLRGCLGEGESALAVRQRMRDPSPFQKYRLESTIARGQGIPWRTWRRRNRGQMREFYQWAALAPDDDLNRLISDAAIEGDELVVDSVGNRVVVTGQPGDDLW